MELIKRDQKVTIEMYPESIFYVVETYMLRRYDSINNQRFIGQKLNTGERFIFRNTDVVQILEE